MIHDTDCKDRLIKFLYIYSANVQNQVVMYKSCTCNVAEGSIL